MGDTNNIQPAGDGTPANASTPAQPKPQSGGEQPVGQAFATVADVERIFNDLFSRKAQSISDMTAAKVQRVVSALQKEGFAATPQSVERLLSSLPQAQPTPQPSTPSPAQVQTGGSEETPEPLPPVLATALEIMTEENVFIEDDDPELKEFQLEDWEKMKRATYLQKVAEAVEAKRTRLAQAGDPARMPSLGGAGGGKGGSKAQLTQELNDALKEPSKNRVLIKELKEQLNKFNT